ncbi:centrosomal protein of 290 kDa-like isoform X1 [Bombyx mandarina]|uniref:Centrosomal protein of 290 kDa-like isoform X1 n=1 Tax=Bombyx mandarina TaxID=7092 RepID=A0A6J2J9G3_BOMMA|nr:centrosomal protein of 290 kDa-like isoform X1 [Bombyx mandarina]
MAEMDWRKILTYTQKELQNADKDSICEGLSWMDIDDIDISFSDLKILFRLTQDVLKYKCEQVKDILGEQATTKRKKGKIKKYYQDSPTKTNNKDLQTINNQEELIKTNREILEKLQKKIKDLESLKNSKELEQKNVVNDNESSVCTLSEMNTAMQLENEIAIKNKHIKKLLADVKVLEEDNLTFKGKVSILKDKLIEATQIIDNLTEQLLSMKNETARLKEILGKSEQIKSQQSAEIEVLKQNSERDVYSHKCTIPEEIKLKIKHWKDMARSKKIELDMIALENVKLKEQLSKTYQLPPTHDEGRSSREFEIKIKELQEKLHEATNEIERSAIIINTLKAEIRQLKTVIEETPDPVSEVRNESDDGKQRAIIRRLRKKNIDLIASLHGADEVLIAREKELSEVTAQLQLIQSEEGVSVLIEGLKNKKNQLKIKDEGIKSLVQEVNVLHQLVTDLQLENETLRQKYNIPFDERVCTKGILKKYRDMELLNAKMKNELEHVENKIIDLELNERCMSSKITKLKKILTSQGYNVDVAYLNAEDDEYNEEILSGAKESLAIDQSINLVQHVKSNNETENIQAIIDENEGLRKALQELLDFLKDNSSTSSGVLALQCPSLESILQKMGIRHAAGWFSPHMSTFMELEAARGGKEALLLALHEARKETFNLMKNLSHQSKINEDLQKKVNELESQSVQNFDLEDNLFEFGSWVTEKEINSVDFYDKEQLQDSVHIKSQLMYENTLKKVLKHFHDQFKVLYDKMNSLAIEHIDKNNHWLIQEERYKAEIENLKIRLQQNEDEDFSNASPGLLPTSNTSMLERRCSYLEDSYKDIRNINENLRNENIECKREKMLVVSENEIKTQKLLLLICEITDKLRSSIALDLFWDQNRLLNEVTLKCRKIAENTFKDKNKTMDMLKCLEENKLEIINYVQKQLCENVGDADRRQILNEVEQLAIEKQLRQSITELEKREKEINLLESKYMELNQLQAGLIDDSLRSVNTEEINFMKSQISNLSAERKILKEQYQSTKDQLEVTILQLQEFQQRQMCKEIEVNILRHQILDLQSTGNNKAVVARLSSELLVTHLQASEYNRKIQELTTALNKEKEMRADIEDILSTRQKVFDLYTRRYDSRFKHIHTVLNVMRLQYQGSLPLTSIENFVFKLEDLSRKNHAINQQLTEVDELRTSLVTKHAVFDQILDVSKDKCLLQEDDCPHKLKSFIMDATHAREMDNMKKKIKISEQVREELLSQCTNLEKTLAYINQGYEKYTSVELKHKLKEVQNDEAINLEDLVSDEEPDSRSSRIAKSQILKPTTHTKATVTDINNEHRQENLFGSPAKLPLTQLKPKVANIFVQTDQMTLCKSEKNIQTEEDALIIDMKYSIESARNDIKIKMRELDEALLVAKKRTEEMLIMESEKIDIQSKIKNLHHTIKEKDNFNNQLQKTLSELRKQVEVSQNLQIEEIDKIKHLENEETKKLLSALKELENDKNKIIEEYKQLLYNEREEYTKAMKELQVKLFELQTKLDRKGSDSGATNTETLKEFINKYTMKIALLEDECFRLKRELEECKADKTIYQNEIERWKDLASERLIKMEQLNSQLEERHSQEVESYKAENQHWLSQLNDTQKEHNELRSRLTEQKALYLKQLADKDAHIENLRTVVHGLKTQIMNMQTMLAVNDPSFDLSAIVEIEETSDVMSQTGSDRLEIKFDSTTDIHEEMVKIPGSSTTIWQETIIERLRREKQLAGKQNAILRRQIKALAARERRARLDAQNLKNQVFRISTSGNKVATAETAALHNKIGSLQAQLTSARRDTQTNVALWDKWKRAQQLSERWQAKYEEKCQEIKKIESNLALTKSAVVRLEKEKRVLFARLNELKYNTDLAVEKQEDEPLEKSHKNMADNCTSYTHGVSNVPLLSMQSLMDRIQAQQRRIAALELSEKGNEHLVSEYEKALAEITSLKGQVLKLESTLLESQIKIPLKTCNDEKPELEYWKSYCEMLKEENVQLNLRINSLETIPTTGHQHRIADLEQTVLTLRGLVGKLQAEQKTAGAVKRTESRPSSGKSASEKNRTQLESYRVEIANLKRSIQDKDLLLERSKEMLKIAAEREDELLRENLLLRRRIDDLIAPKEGFLSA